MKILLIGSGGRESAIAWKLAQNKNVKNIYVAPGNGGIDLINKCCSINLKNNNEYLDFAKENKIDLTIVGPEQPLVEGVVDLFRKNKLIIFGPNKKGAILEGSKIYAKNFMKKYTIATAEYKTFTDKYAAKAYLKKVNFPIVIKANGLAAGKGVVICHKLIEANKCVDEMMVEKKFKDAGNSIVIEEFLKGVEASIVCVTDGKTIVPLISSQDHKAIYDGNKGPNTGGMGAICPNQHLTKEIMDDFVKNIMLPTLKGTQKEKMDFHGFIFFGVMITSKGCKCLEYNVRLGDPETQSILPLMHFDFLKMIQFTLKNQLNKFKFKWKKQIAINVVLASKGYPGNYQKGDEIKIINNPLLFYSGVKSINNKLITNGGRVLSVVALGKTIKETYKKVYHNVRQVNFDGMYYRKDIGLI